MANFTSLVSANSAREFDSIASGWFRGVENSALRSVLVVVLGVFALSLLAQVVIPLSWTPVPITGQTFGVALIALLWGRKQGLAVFAAYLTLAYLGVPVLAAGKSGLLLGATFGYLVGMAAAIVAVGYLSDIGFVKGFWTSLLSVYLGSVFVFGFGLLGLSFFVGGESLLAAGLYPFLLGDLIKNVAASSVYTALRK